MWGKMSPHEVLADVADFRNAFERKQSSSSQTHGVNKYFSSQSHVQKSLSIYDWNPGSRRGREDHLRNKLRRNGILLPCKKHLTLLIMIFFKNDFT